MSAGNSNSGKILRIFHILVNLMMSKDNYLCYFISYKLNDKHIGARHKITCFASHFAKPLKGIAIQRGQ